MSDWLDEIDQELMVKIKKLSREEAIAVIIYFCGYENGENLVEQAMGG